MKVKIKEFLELIDEYQSPINKEIKDDKKAEKVWALMSDLESELEGLTNEWAIISNTGNSSNFFFYVVSR